MRKTRQCEHCSKKGKNYVKIDDEEDEPIYLCRSCYNQQKKEMHQRIKNTREIFKIKQELQKESDKAIKSQLCKKCGGVIVRSWITSMMAASHGKRCNCKNKKVSKSSLKT